MSQASSSTSCINSDKAVFGSVFIQEDIRIALNDAGVASDEDTLTTFLKDHRRAFRDQEERMCESGNEFLAEAVETWMKLTSGKIKCPS